MNPLQNTFKRDIIRENDYMTMELVRQVLKNGDNALLRLGKDGKIIVNSDKVTQYGVIQY